MRAGGAHVNPAFVLIPGAGGVAWYWHRVVPLLEDAGHEAIAVDLPGDDAGAGLSAYAARVVRAIGARRDVVLVAQSLGGFTAPLVCARVRVGMLVFVNAMIPVPGETAGAWWDDTGASAARVAAARRGGWGTTVDLDAYFLHDVPPDVVAESGALRRTEAEVVFRERCDFERWPDVPIRVIAGRDDRFFPLSFQRRIARERLHVGVDALRGGHLVALSNPKALADRLLRYVRRPAEKAATRRPSGAASGPRAASPRRRPARDRLVARLRRICMALPEAREKPSHGEPTWFAGTGKVFAMLDDHHHGAPHLAVWLPQPLGAQEALVGSDPERFFRPPYVGPSGWVGVVLDGDPDWRRVAALVREAYLHVATPKLRSLARDLRGSPEHRV